MRLFAVQSPDVTPGKGLGLGLGSGQGKGRGQGQGQGVCREVTHPCMTHNDMVSCLSFCDPLRVFASSSLDCTVRIWDFNKQVGQPPSI